MINGNAPLAQTGGKRSGGTGDGEGNTSVAVFDATISDEDYFADEGIDQSMLKQWLRSPAALGLYLRDQETGVSSPALEFGTAMHALTLGKGLPVMEKKPRAKTDEQHTWLTPSAYATAMDMQQLGGAKEYFQSLGGTAETVMMADDPATGLRLKAKADWLPATVDADGVYRIRDYKTTMKPLNDSDAANRIIYGDLRYDIQAAFYMMVYRLASGWTGALGFEFVIQSKTAPYTTVRASIDEKSDANQETLQTIREGLAALKQAQGDNTREEFLDRLLVPQPVVNLGAAVPPAWWTA